MLSLGSSLCSCLLSHTTASLQLFDPQAAEFSSLNSLASLTLATWILPLGASRAPAHTARLPDPRVPFAFVCLSLPQPLPYIDIKRCCRLIRASSGLTHESWGKSCYKEVGGKGACGGCSNGDGKSCDAQHQCACWALRGRGSTHSCTRQASTQGQPG